MQKRTVSTSKSYGRAFFVQQKNLFCDQFFWDAFCLSLSRKRGLLNIYISTNAFPYLVNLFRATVSCLFEACFVRQLGKPSYFDSLFTHSLKLLFDVSSESQILFFSSFSPVSLKPVMSTTNY